jgi:hypothetical protein
MPTQELRITRRIFTCVIFAALACSAWVAEGQTFDEWAQTPTMGWNSWDTYGSSVTEAEVRANAQYMADNLKEYGWEYVVVDIRWYVDNPGTHSYTPFDQTQFNYNGDGIMLPSLNRFPSTTNGSFGQLASDIHDMGLKFGMHMMRGINREFYDDVDKNTRIGSSPYRFSDLVVQNNGAFWLNDNYGLQKNPAAQAWYDLMISTYAEWGMDFIKVDDVSAAVYRTGEVEMLRSAIDRVYNETGRRVVLSTSPGPTADIDNNFTLDPNIASHVQANANQWRITNDLWDNWGDVYDMFERAHRWTPYRTEGHWPDNDMLPLGRLGIRGHVGSDRMSNLTHDEQTTMMSLWSITRSPLMFGGDLPSNDSFTLSLLTNPEVLAVNQHSSNNRQLYRAGDRVAWVADAPGGGKYLALFNLGSAFDSLLGEASYVSDLITKNTPGRSTPINVDVTGKDRMYLLVDDGDGPGPDPDVFDYDWADWVNLQLSGPNGQSVSVADLGWVSATSGWQGPRVGLNNEGTGPLLINGVEYQNGIGTHSVSIIEYELPDGVTTLTGLAGLDDGGVNQLGSTASVRFAVTALEGELGAALVDASLADLGFTEEVVVRDLWTRSDVGRFSGSFATLLESHASGLFLIALPSLAGDFNGDGVVGAADYTVWRNHLGEVDSILAFGSTEDGSGVVDYADYVTWKGNYGAEANTLTLGARTIPEPSSASMFCTIGLVWVVLHRRRVGRPLGTA